KPRRARQRPSPSRWWSRRRVSLVSRLRPSAKNAKPQAAKSGALRMSFKLFIYYCALCGGWAAFLCWAVAQGSGIRDIQSEYGRAALIAAVLGLLVAGGIGMVDAILNAVG